MHAIMTPSTGFGRRSRGNVRFEKLVSRNGTKPHQDRPMAIWNADLRPLVDGLCGHAAFRCLGNFGSAPSPFDDLSDRQVGWLLVRFRRFWAVIHRNRLVEFNSRRKLALEENSGTKFRTANLAGGYPQIWKNRPNLEKSQKG